MVKKHVSDFTCPYERFKRASTVWNGAMFMHAGAAGGRHIEKQDDYKVSFEFDGFLKMSFDPCCGSASFDCLDEDSVTAASVTAASTVSTQPWPLRPTARHRHTH